ncbi:MAG: YCF48-related protein [Paludibacter sp.]
MNKLLIILLCFVIFTNCKKEEIAIPSESDSWKRITQLVIGIDEINDMCLSDKNNLWVVGNHNYFVRSTDGGANWQNVVVDATLPTFNYWISIYFKTPQLGWIAGGQYIYKTTDGGATWKPLITPKDGIVGPNCIYFTTETTGFLSCGSGKLYRTTDGGKTWTDQSIPTLYSLWTITFVNEQCGWVGGGGTLLKTIDGGKTWTTLHSSNDGVASPFFTQTMGRNISATSTTNLYEATDDFIASIDGGTVWKSINTELFSRWILMRNDNEGFCVINKDDYLNGSSSMAHTVDGGKTWARFKISTDTESLAKKIIRFENTLYIFTTKNEIFKYDKEW